MYQPVAVRTASDGVRLRVSPAVTPLLDPVQIKKLIDITRTELALPIKSLLGDFVDQVLLSLSHDRLYICDKTAFHRGAHDTSHDRVPDHLICGGCGHGVV